MPSPLTRDELRARLDQPNPHDITAAADTARRERHGLTTHVAIVDRLDAKGSHAWCPLTGAIAPEGGFARSLDALSDRSSDLILLVEPGATATEMEATWALVGTPPVELDAMLPTVQIGTVDDWITAGLVDQLDEWSARGVRVVSDGIAPTHHPARGDEAAAHWKQFWTAAAAADMSGHATVLFGPDIDMESVFDQIEAIAELQRDTGVFLSVSPCVIGKGAPSEADALLTHASFDLRVLAACRLGLTEVPHLSHRYDRSDLKNAHTSLLCGVDDLMGHLFLGDRNRKADAEAFDLSVTEMQKWLEEAGFTARVRNGAFEVESFDTWLSMTGGDATGEDQSSGDQL